MHSSTPPLPILILGLLLSWNAAAAAPHPSDWAEGTPGRDDGATRDYYNRAALLRWRNQLGDWHDAAGKAQGNEPFAAAALGRAAVGQAAEWDVTPLVEKWTAGEHPNRGMLLRRLAGGGEFHFHSREHADAQLRPQLVVANRSETFTLSPAADTYLEPSTYRAMGGADSLRVGGRNHALLRFDLSALPKNSPLEKATLRLHAGAAYGDEATIGVFRCSQGHDEPPSEPLAGLAAKYRADRGIGDDPDVIFHADFEADDWAKGWTHVAELRVIDTVAADEPRKFEPLSGKALRVRIAEGATGALNTLFKFQNQIGSQPEEIYFRYYLRLAGDWNQTLQGGKMPGISGTYGRAGWGGRKSDGTNGWSARGAFHLTIPEGNPLAGRHPIGTYCYHADMPGIYGETWLWQRDYRGYLENNRWYCIEQHLKLNTPGEKDGVLRAWVDGRPAFEKTDIRFRHVETLKIEQVWMNVYHGGRQPSPYDQHLYIDNVVIARQYIGPLAPLAAIDGRGATH